MKTKTNGKATKPATSKEAAKDLSVAYNQFKEFEGKLYTGMKIGRSHKWYYDQGVWKETKITPDLWQIEYAVVKRRAGKAPEGSGVPVGTEYHWYILSHQNVRKLDANSYTTAMTGLKFKLAHRRADKNKWSITEKGQQKRLIKFLRDTADKLEKEQAKTKTISPAADKEIAVKKTPAASRKKRAVKKEAPELEYEIF
jgi:hypothetical protein